MQNFFAFQKPWYTISKKEKTDIVRNLEKEMQEAAKNLDFERAMELRDIIFEMKSE